MQSDDRTTGSGEWTFRYHRELSALPEKALRHLPGAHGGFAVDWRGERDVYFALKGCGILHMSPDLSQKRVIDVEPFLREGNFHNTSLIYDDRGTPHLALPDDEKERVYVTTTEGKLVQVLSHPRGNEYYDSWGVFRPTDVEQVPAKDVYITTGYSPGDFVVTANPFSGEWKPLIFGGRGREHGKFGTGHGVAWNSREKSVDVADRPQSRIESFEIDGRYRKTVELPEGAWPCDVDYLDGWAAVGCLKGPGESVPAPIYVLDADGRIVSTLKPHEDLGLELFVHVHNATWHAIGDGAQRRVVLLCQAWNPGGFAVLEQIR